MFVRRRRPRDRPTGTAREIGTDRFPKSGCHSRYRVGREFGRNYPKTTTRVWQGTPVVVPGQLEQPVFEPLSDGGPVGVVRGEPPLVGHDRPSPVSGRAYRGRRGREKSGVRCSPGRRQYGPVPTGTACGIGTGGFPKSGCHSRRQLGREFGNNSPKTAIRVREGAGGTGAMSAQRQACVAPKVPPIRAGGQFEDGIRPKKNRRKVLSLRRFRSARATGLEPATTGSTVRR